MYSPAFFVASFHQPCPMLGCGVSYLPSCQRLAACNVMRLYSWGSSLRYQVCTEYVRIKKGGHCCEALMQALTASLVNANNHVIVNISCNQLVCLEAIHLRMMSLL